MCAFIPFQRKSIFDFMSQFSCICPHSQLFMQHILDHVFWYTLLQTAMEDRFLYTPKATYYVLLCAQHPLLRGWINFPKNLEAFLKLLGPKGWREAFPIWGPTVIRRRCTKFSHPGIFHPTKSDCARPPSIFARFSICWLLFVPKSEIPLEGAPLWFDFGLQKAVTSTLHTIAKDDFYRVAEKSPYTQKIRTSDSI